MAFYFYQPINSCVRCEWTIRFWDICYAMMHIIWWYGAIDEHVHILISSISGFWVQIGIISVLGKNLPYATFIREIMQNDMRTMQTNMRSKEGQYLRIFDMLCSVCDGIQVLIALCLCYYININNSVCAKRQMIFYKKNSFPLFLQQILFYILFVYSCCSKGGSAFNSYC